MAIQPPTEILAPSFRFPPTPLGGVRERVWTPSPSGRAS